MPTSATALDLADPSAELSACLDRLVSRDFSDLDADQQAGLLRALGRVEARVTSLRFQLLAAAEKNGTAARTGAASTGHWAARIERSDHRTAHRQVGLATGLGDRPIARKALSDGRISAEHAAVIVHADRQLPTSLTAGQRTEIEDSLVDKAQRLAPEALRKAARRALEVVARNLAAVDAHENDQVLAEEDRARERTQLTLHDNQDGTGSLHFTGPILHIELLGKILATMTAPRRAHLGATEAHAGAREATTDWARARGGAFCELIEHLPTDHLHPKTAATVIVTLHEDALHGALRAAGVDTGSAISAGEARRLACTSGVLPAVLGGDSFVLDLGRRSRLFSEPQRVAKAATQQTCAADGCDRPFAWLELHHRTRWSDGGTTNVADAIGICHFHHQRIHDPRYQHVEGRDGSITFTRRI